MDPVKPYTSGRFDFQPLRRRWKRSGGGHRIGREKQLVLKKVHHQRHRSHDGQRQEEQLGGKSDLPSWRMPLQ
jgi:hypothetical protein